MSNIRLSINQKDTLFVLVLLAEKGRFEVAISKSKKIISQNRNIDSSNYRKGILLLSGRGMLSLRRSSDLSLHMRLSTEGWHIASKIYTERTGEYSHEYAKILRSSIDNI